MAITNPNGPGRRSPALAVLAMLAPLAAAAEPPLVSPDWLAEHSCDPEVAVIDLRRSPDDYRVGHVPCAVYSSFHGDGWRATVGGVAMMMPPAPRLEALIGGLGINGSHHVILSYDGGGPADLAEAARVYFVFKFLGHDRVSILDGGYPAYAADWHNDIETGNRQPEPQSFAATPRPDLVAIADEVEAALAEGTPLIDLRSSDHHLGINREPILARPGTLPGARNLPLDWLTVDRGLVPRRGPALEALFDAADTPTEGAAIFFCNSGLESALGWFVAYALLGNREVRLYDGSLAEWSADPRLPMEVKVPLPEE